MKLTIFGATGGVGRHLLDQARAAGHDVTAVARNPNGLPDGTRIVRADLIAPDRAAVDTALQGADAVLSSLGPRTKSDTGIASQGTRTILEAMNTTGVCRIVVVSAAPIGTVPSPGRPTPARHDPGDGFFMRHLLSPLTKTALRKPYTDLAVMEDVLRASDLDWTVIRPPRLTNKRPTDKYRIAYGQNVRGGLAISRADVAHLMLDVLDRPEAIKQTVGVAN
jgi:putative NADH-flavin reductase